MRVSKMMQVPIKASIKMRPPVRPTSGRTERVEPPVWREDAPVGSRGHSFATIPLFPPSSTIEPFDHDRDPAAGEGEGAVPDVANITSVLLASAGAVPEASLDGG